MAWRNQPRIRNQVIDVRNDNAQIQYIQSLRTLIEQHDNMIDSNAENIEVHEKFKRDYVVLRGHLKRFADKLEYEALVPLGPKVLAFGKIIHTNEITCLLGDNWFVECTAKKATEIVNHRITKCDEMLKKLKKEGELFSSWKSETQRHLDETTEHDTAEIIEEYNEDNEKRWRQERREKVKKYNQELGKNRKENPESSLTDEEMLWNRLDELELEETLSRRKEDTQFVSFPIQTAALDKNLCLKELATERESIVISTPFPVSDQNKPIKVGLKSHVNIVERTSEQSVDDSVETVKSEKRISKFKQSRKLQ